MSNRKTSAANVATDKCSYCGKPIPKKRRAVRGLGPCCYDAVRRAVRAGEITEDALIRRGYMEPRPKKGPQGRKPSSPFAKDLASGKFEVAK